MFFCKIHTTSSSVLIGAATSDHSFESLNRSQFLGTKGVFCKKRKQIDALILSFLLLQWQGQNTSSQLVNFSKLGLPRA